jgi:hypothetical protein
MPEITIACALCGNQKSIQLKEHKRQLKQGRQHFFCSKSCAGKFGNIQRWRKKVVSPPPVDSIGPDTVTEQMNNIKQITLTKDENGQYMPHEWVRERISSFYPGKAKYKMLSDGIDRKREKWSKETITPTEPAPSNDLEQAVSDNTALSEDVNDQLEQKQDQQLDEEDKPDFDEYSDPFRAEEWEKGSPSMHRHWNKAIDEQQAYEDSKLPFTAGELSLKEEMSQAAVRVLNADDQPCGYIVDTPHEREATKVIKDRKARISEAEEMASAEEESD